MARVVCLGLLVADVVGRPIEAFPPRGTLAPVERIELRAGGCAANTDIALARLGVPTAVLGKAGGGTPRGNDAQPSCLDGRASDSTGAGLLDLMSL